MAFKPRTSRSHVFTLASHLPRLKTPLAKPKLVYLAGSYPRTVKATLSGNFLLPKPEPRLPASPASKIIYKPETMPKGSLGKVKYHSETISPAPPISCGSRQKSVKKSLFFAEILPKKSYLSDLKALVGF